VGAIDDTDAFAYFSNYGECVEIQAPVSSTLCSSSYVASVLVFEIDFKIYN